MSKQLHIFISQELDSKLQQLAKKLGRTKSDLAKEGILLILEKYSSYLDNSDNVVYIEKSSPISYSIDNDIDIKALINTIKKFTKG